MTKKRKFALLASSIVCLGAVIGASVSNAISANSTNLIDIDSLDSTLKEVYKYNDIFNIPALDIDGVNEYTSVLVFPDGSAKTGSTLTLDQVGNYKLKYIYKKNNKVENIERSFEVKFGSYFFSGSNEIKSSAQYTTFTSFGEGQKYSHDLLWGPNPKYLQTDKTDCYPNTGLLVELAKGEKLTFSTPVSVDKFIGDPFIQLYAVPYTQLTVDYNRIYVDLVDSENPDIFASIMIQKCEFDNGYMCYSGVNARGENQIYTGLEIKEPDAPNKWHKNDIWGSLVFHSFYSGIHVGESTGWPNYKGTLIECPTSYAQLCLGYNNETKTVFDCTQSPLTPRKLEEKTMTYVADLDSTEAFDELWNGFKSDKVYVSIYLDQYAGSTGRIMIPYYKFADLSADYVEDAEVPNLVVNTNYTPTSMPKATIGSPYTIPTATGYDDLCGKTKVTIDVDYNYLSGNPTSVEIRNNKFVPTKEGIYRINYSTVDAFGNKTSVSYYVETDSTLDPLGISIDSAAKNTPVIIGTRYEYPTPTITGGSGDKEFKVYATDGKDTYDITEEGSVLIDSYSEWKIKYVVTDFAGNEATTEYYLNLTVEDKYFVYDEINFDQYFFNNISIDLPKVYAYNYYPNGKKKSTLCSVDIDYKGNVTTLASGTSYVPSVQENHDLIKLTYNVNGVKCEGTEVIERETINLISKKQNSQYVIQAKNYFAGAEDYATLAENSIQFNNKTSDTPIDISWTFVNKFLPSSNSVQISNNYDKKTRKTSSDLSSFEVTFTDAFHEDESITATINVSRASLSIVVGSDTYPSDFAFNNNIANNFTMNYENNQIIFTDSKSKSLRMSILRYDNGELFNGFTSNYLLVSVTAKGVRKDNGYGVVSMCNQLFNVDITEDNFAPSAYTVGGVGGSYKQHSFYTTGKALGCDVLSPNVKTTISVLNPDDTYAYDINGKELKDLDPTVSYTFELKYLGIYTIMVRSSEDNWPWTNYNPDRPTINCVDVKAPTITLSEQIPGQAKLGSTIMIPGINVSDDVTPANKITIFIALITPNARELQVDMNGGFKLSLVGTYYLLITATDEAGNLGQLFFTIECVPN